MNKIFVLWVFILLGLQTNSQISHYNQYPTFSLHHILDDKLENISFALSLRVLVSDYNGPIIRLRRANDNLEEDFFADSSNDIVDLNAIDAWRNGNAVFVVRWYDQSGLNRDAIQTDLSRQPPFTSDPIMPYIQGDGRSDRLDVLTSIQLLTNAGANGTVLSVMSVTRRQQNSFGVLNQRNRWSVHANWGNGSLYFDPGMCCNNPRQFNNNDFTNKFAHYTFIRATNSVTVRLNNVQKLSGNYTRSRCTLNNNFGIFYANGLNSRLHSNMKLSEFIMYSTDIPNTVYEDIEKDSILCWEL
ncbi:arabinofuranosidase catalytic domain-containing protein [Tamlana sp. 2201CG12-4]|uniref:arabinofuranosidase catalytic domain-containing protein n=1 Tax=Tamlana sp. 2201CG12-4 TaxID=3112582 RepID=UPI002DBFD653|nr:arabinofuranosidase catalytic domain-containing protein [Tamlana sp. 2201CG12-4]MEC3908708.1 arabinofuranosidase catalytic domain-containing protein [Tamlana sp. 2201CG12-4]